MTITIVNKYHKSGNAPPMTVYCGRGSPFGNPFVMMSSTDRDAVCDNYQKHFDERIEKNDLFKDAIDHLVKLAKEGDLNLQCFCAPKRCHTETIKAHIEQQLKIDGA